MEKDALKDNQKRVEEFLKLWDSLGKRDRPSQGDDSNKKQTDDPREELKIQTDEEWTTE